MTTSLTVGTSPVSFLVCVARSASGAQELEAQKRRPFTCEASYPLRVDRQTAGEPATSSTTWGADQRHASIRILTSPCRRRPRRGRRFWPFWSRRGLVRLVHPLPPFSGYGLRRRRGLRRLRTDVSHCGEPPVRRAVAFSSGAGHVTPRSRSSRGSRACPPGAPSNRLRPWRSGPRTRRSGPARGLAGPRVGGPPRPGGSGSCR